MRSDAGASGKSFPGASACKNSRYTSAVMALARILKNTWKAKEREKGLCTVMGAAVKVEGETACATSRATENSGKFDVKNSVKYSVYQTEELKYFDQTPRGILFILFISRVLY